LTVGLNLDDISLIVDPRFSLCSKWHIFRTVCDSKNY